MICLLLHLMNELYDLFLFLINFIRLYHSLIYCIRIFMELSYLKLVLS